MLMPTHFFCCLWSCMLYRETTTCVRHTTHWDRFLCTIQFTHFFQGNKAAIHKRRYRVSTACSTGYLYSDRSDSYALHHHNGHQNKSKQYDIRRWWIRQQQLRDKKKLRTTRRTHQASAKTMWPDTAIEVCMCACAVSSQGWITNLLANKEISVWQVFAENW